LVNNAGTGLNHGVSSEALIQTNYYGVQRVTEAFLPLINKSCGRIINVGSGAGPIFVSK
jgi:short-subunit dehydrogenase